jgi:hypothetical protein
MMGAQTWVFGVGLCLVAVAQASTVSFVGSDSADNSWRTSSVAKPLDPDGDNIYGTAGFALLGSSIGTQIINPDGVLVTQLTGNTFNGNGGYTQIDNPLGTGTITSGVWYDNPVSAGAALDFAALTFSATESYVVGIYTDNTDFADISPSSLRISQVAGAGSGDSGYISNTPGQGGDWFLFNVSGNAGDVFDVSGIATGSPETGSDGIGLITFDAGSDSTAPEPGTIALTLASMAFLVWRRTRIPHGKRWRDHRQSRTIKPPFFRACATLVYRAGI